MEHSAIALTAQALKAAAITAPVKADVRYYLMAVCIQRADAGDVFAIGTDGHCLSAQKVEQSRRITGEPFECLLPLDAVKALPKKGEVLLSFDSDAKTYSLSHADGTRSGAVVDGRYPEWRRIVPREASGEAATFDPDLLARLQKSARTAVDVKAAALRIHHNGENSTLASTAETDAWIGVCMPLRIKETLPAVSSLVSDFI
jgi:DNA polymerase III sliding clamp (beta) subunit (PCNA family)